MALSNVLALLAALALGTGLQERGAPPADRFADVHARIERGRERLQERDLGGARAAAAEGLELLLASAASDPAAEPLMLQLAVLAYRSGDLGGELAALRALCAAQALRLPDDDVERNHRKTELASALRRTGDYPGARVLLEEALPHLERALPGDPELLVDRIELAIVVRELGDLHGAREALEQMLVETDLPPEHRTLLFAKQNLAVTLLGLGDRDAAYTLFEEVLETCERTFRGDDPKVLDARANLAAALATSGDLPRARELFARNLEVLERMRPADHPDVLQARRSLALTQRDLGDLHGALPVMESVLEVYERTLPADHPELLRARMSLAETLRQLGALDEALILYESVAESRARTLPHDHPDVALAQLGIVVVLTDAGDWVNARRLCEEAVARLERALTPGHPELLKARGNLATVLVAAGELQRALGLQESVVADLARLLPDDDPLLLGERRALAGTLRAVGDLSGARALLEELDAIAARVLPDEHPERFALRQAFANLALASGDRPAALLELARLADDSERVLGPDHPTTLTALAGSAMASSSSGELESAERAVARLVEACAELPPDHGVACRARACEARLQRRRGEFAAARAGFEALLADYEARLPADHPRLLETRHELASLLDGLGEQEAALAQASAYADGVVTGLIGTLGLSPRAAREVASDAAALALVLSIGGGSCERAFALVETRRLASSAAALSTALDAPEFATLRAAALRARTRLNDLVSNLRSPRLESADPPEDALSAIQDAVQARDRAERELRKALVARGVFARPIEADELARALPEGSAAVGFLRYPRWTEADAHGTERPTQAHLLAHVVRRDGFARVELGPVAELEELAGAWRAALGRPVAARGRPVHAASAGLREEEVEALGRALRARLLDPVLAAAGDAATLHVAPDDLVFLVPLDALPLEGGGVIGDRLRIVSEISFARLIAPAPKARSAPALLVLGGVAYDDPIEGPAAIERDGGADGFAALPGSAEEIAALSALFEQVFETEPVQLLGAGATKAALHARAPGARFVHLATHGWFAGESVMSVLDGAERGASGARLGLEQTITGLAPMTLCGLALAGANQGRNARGNVPGILTGEELCALDLAQCELAVLSACETNVGLRRAGQGIQSLQSALHAAGARTAITSLWKVDDAATRELMAGFYAKLWVERLPKVEALWAAKSELRRAGRPVRDWGAWVLSGDPE